MLERLRQVAFMVLNLEEGRELSRGTLDMESCHSEDLSEYGLSNLVLPAGEGTFVELLQSTSAETPGPGSWSAGVKLLTCSSSRQSSTTDLFPT